MGHSTAMLRSVVFSGIERLRSVLAWVLVIGLTGCAVEPAEQRLQAAVTGLQTAIEAREVRNAMDFIAEDFVGTGTLDREGVRSMLRVQVLRHAQLGLTLGPMQTELTGDRATVRFTAVATGGSGALMPESARVWEVETGWRDDDGEWRLISAQWK
jgi:uncharacterized protein YqgV (UPF0045/DUF77 family)